MRLICIEILKKNPEEYNKQFSLFMENRASSNFLRTQFLLIAEKISDKPPSDAEILRAKEKLRIKQLARLKFNFPKTKFT
jgi:hypothetical protein